MDRKDILDKAGSLISGDRHRDYGNWHENTKIIGILWGEILQCREHGVPYPTPEQVTLCMDALKTARLIKNPKHVDSWIDKCGYSGLGGESALHLLEEEEGM